MPPRRIIGAFVIAGAAGVLASSMLEYYLLTSGVLANIEVGLIEELVEAVLILGAAIGIRSFRVRDGMMLGAAVGFGFAALESSGYALVSLFVVQHNQLLISLPSLLMTELARGVLAPFAHGMWSAIVGGAIFAAARRRGHLRLGWGVLVAYLAMAALHAAFDINASVFGYVVVAAVGLIPLVWMWRRSDGRSSSVADDKHSQAAA